MNVEQTATLLAKIALFDGRKVDQLTIIAWQEVLDRVRLDDALEGLTDMRRRTDKWVMPSDIITHARIARDRRKREERRAVKSAPSVPEELSEADRDQIDAVYERAVNARRAERGLPSISVRFFSRREP